MIAEATFLTRDYTLSEINMIKRVVGVVFPDLGEFRAVELMQHHPDSQYKAPSYKNCYANAYRAGGHLLSGFRIFAATLNGRIARLQLDGHIWNRIGEHSDDWFDTTPVPPEYTGISHVLLVIQPNNAVLATLTQYLIKRGVLVMNGMSPQAWIDATTKSDGAKPRFDIKINDDGELEYPPTIFTQQLFCPIALRDKILAAMIPFPSIILYLGPAQIQSEAHGLHFIDTMITESLGTIRMDLCEKPAEKKCCWNCGTSDAQFQCSACRTALYCSSECQIADRKDAHRAECKRWKK